MTDQNRKSIVAPVEICGYAPTRRSRRTVTSFSKIVEETLTAEATVDFDFNWLGSTSSVTLDGEVTSRRSAVGNSFFESYLVTYTSAGWHVSAFGQPWNIHLVLAHMPGAVSLKCPEYPRARGICPARHRADFRSGHIPVQQQLFDKRPLEIGDIRCLLACDFKP